MYLSWKIHELNFHTLLRILPHILHTLSHNFGLFWPFLAYFSKLGVQWYVLKLENSWVKLSNTFTITFTLSHTLQTFFTHFWPFWAFFYHFQQIECLQICTWAGKLINETFTLFNTLVHILSHTLWPWFTHLEPFWLIFGIKWHDGFQKVCTQAGVVNGDLKKILAKPKNKTNHTKINNMAKLWHQINLRPIVTC